MKLSLTNSPIGLIVLIDHAHHRCAWRSNDKPRFCPDGARILRMLPADGPPNRYFAFAKTKWRRPLACMAAKSNLQTEKSKDVFKSLFE
jgi:hypothetical protein